jgi:hypothetical protein
VSHRIAHQAATRNEWRLARGGRAEFVPFHCPSLQEESSWNRATNESRIASRSRS